MNPIPARWHYVSPSLLYRVISLFITIYVCEPPPSPPPSQATWFYAYPHRGTVYCHAKGEILQTLFLSGLVLRQWQTLNLCNELRNHLCCVVLEGKRRRRDARKGYCTGALLHTYKSCALLIIITSSYKKVCDRTRSSSSSCWCTGQVSFSCIWN